MYSGVFVIQKGDRITNPKYQQSRILIILCMNVSLLSFVLFITDDKSTWACYKQGGAEWGHVL